jgi:hypothetical protein
MCTPGVVLMQRIRVAQCGRMCVIVSMKTSQVDAWLAVSHWSQHLCFACLTAHCTALLPDMTFKQVAQCVAVCVLLLKGRQMYMHLCITRKHGVHMCVCWYHLLLLRALDDACIFFWGCCSDAFCGEIVSASLSVAVLSY